MKLKYLLSAIGSFFLVSESKAQTPVTKETQPQVKSDVPVVVPKIGDKQLSDKQISEKLMGKEPVSSKGVVTKTEKFLPITVKPGDNIYLTNFATDPVGDMPLRWKTNNIGTLSNIVGQEGNWLKLDENSTYELMDSLSLTGNFKVEFDFIANYKEDQTVPEVTLRLFKKIGQYYEPGVFFSVSPNGGSSSETTRVMVTTRTKGGAEHFRSAAKHLAVFQNKNGKNQPVRVALSVKGNTVSAWLDGEKIYQLTEAYPEEIRLDRLGFETSTYGGPKVNYSYYISNIRITAE